MNAKVLKIVPQVFQIQVPGAKYQAQDDYRITCYIFPENTQVNNTYPSADLLIRQKFPCNVYPLIPQFYIETNGVTGVHLFFLFLL